MDRLELQKLRDRPIEEVAERLGLRVTRHKCLCPFHDDHSPSLSFSAARNTYRCFVCGAHGDAIDLVMKLQNMGFREACQWMMEGSLSTTFTREREERCQRAIARSFDASRYERFFERPWLTDAARRFLFGERRLDERVVRWCRLTSWRDRQGVDWLQIPYFDMEGKLIGIQNRNLRPSQPPLKGGDQSAKPMTQTKSPNTPAIPHGSLPLQGGAGEGPPRFRFPQGSRCSIYNLPVLKLLRPGEELYITEGASDCWSMLSSGHKAIAIPSATLLNRKDMEVLSALESSLSLTLHMYPDRDAPGEKLFMDLQALFPTLEHHQLPPGCKDYSDYYMKNASSRGLTP